MKVESYDFRKPGRLVSDIEELLTKWFSTMCSRVPEKWAKQISAHPELVLRGIESLRLDEALGQLGSAAVGYRVAFNGAENNGLLVLSRPLVLLLAAGMVGDAVTEVPQDREITVVEESLLEYFIEQYLLNGLQESWAGVDPPALRLGPREPDPEYSRLSPPETIVVVCSFSIRGAFGEQPWRWITNQKSLLGYLERVFESRQAHSSEQDTRRQMEQLVCGVPVEMSVTLGEAELPLSMLAELRTGDVLLLRQRVCDPLIASVAGVRKLRAWPGRVGQQQAVQIDSSFET
jgi:flagellar motor switch protein FliM